MGYTIELQPSGRKFSAEPQESLLEAALRHGIAIEYNCSIGTCGDCRARVMSGDVVRTRQQDYTLRGADRHNGTILLCSHSANSDLVLEAREARGPDDLPLQEIACRVSRVEQPHPEVAILHLRTPRSQILRFLAGQHVQITAADDSSGELAVASCPCNGLQLQFHLPHGPRYPFGQRILAQAALQAPFLLRGPFGQFHLPDESERPILCIASRHHLAPLKSIIEHAINRDYSAAIRLVWLADHGGHYLDNHCRSWGESLDDYAYLPLAGFDDPETISRVVRTWLATGGTLLNGWDIYLSVAASEGKQLAGHLERHGARRDRIFIKRLRRQSRA
jgi:CDP-4-dehydro-6-deoxyglucose reductase, E3